MNSSLPNNSSAVVSTRVLAVLLIVSALLLNYAAFSWVLPLHKIGHPVLVRQLIMVGQGLLASIGVLVLLMPVLFASRPSLSKLLIGVGSLGLIIGLLGNLGSWFSPPIDYRVQTDPAFSCSAPDPYCNTALAAGLRDVTRYGKGAAFADINGDGWVDIFAADAEPRDNADWGVSSFYLNNGDGTFSSADIGVHPDDLLSSWAGSFADMDNDGDQDLVLVGGGYAGEGRLALYENRMQEEGKFIAITEAAGLEAENNKLHRWWGVAWADFDADGYLDFAVSRVYGRSLLFRNNGNNTFSNVTEKMGIETRVPAKRDGKNIVWIDYDLDGDADLYFAGIHAHMFFENLEGKYFLDVTEKLFDGLLPDNWIYPEGSPVVFSAGAVDINQDGADDIYLGRQIEQDLVLFNDGAGSFSAKGRDIGINANLSAKNNETVIFENTMGLGIGDLFDDGWPDIIIGTGDPVRADEDIIYCNQGGTFERCTGMLRDNADGPLRTRTHGVVFGDVNQDGATDVFQSLGGHAPWDKKTGIDSREKAALFVSKPYVDNNTATLLLEGSVGNRDAIGARIKVIADEIHYYTIRSTQAFQSQNDRATIVALGKADTAEVEIIWPGGGVSKVKVDAGGRVAIKEGG
jgi:hypothetical protein